MLRARAATKPCYSRVHRAWCSFCCQPHRLFHLHQHVFSTALLCSEYGYARGFPGDTGGVTNAFGWFVPVIFDQGHLTEKRDPVPMRRRRAEKVISYADDEHVDPPPPSQTHSSGARSLHVLSGRFPCKKMISREKQSAHVTFALAHDDAILFSAFGL